MQLSTIALALTRLGGRNNSPSRLFNAGEQGVWYDPSDRATLFQDAAGTTPVTAVEQPVGLVLDKSKGLVLGPELVVNSAWTTSTGWSVDTSTGVTTAIAAEGTIRNNGTGGSKLISGKWYQATIRLVSYVSGSVGYPYDGTGFTSIPTTPGTYTYRFLCDNPNDWTYVYGNAFTGVVDNISVRELPGNHAYQSTSASRPVLSARVNQYVGTATLATQNVTTLAATYTLRFEGTGSITLSGTATGTYSAGTHSVVCTAGTLTSTVTGTVTNADIRVANVGVGLPVYQRVTTSTDYDTAGFPQREYFDGVDDAYTIAAGGGGTTAFFFCACINVAAVGVEQTIISDTGTNTGYRVRINASNQLEISAGNGTAYTTANTTATVSIGQTYVITCWHDGTNLNAQINNGTVAQQAFAAATAGTASITVGKDNGAATRYFKGSIFACVYVKDDVQTVAQIASAKKYCATKGKLTI